MAFILQPAIQNDFGVMLTIGINANVDRCAIVLPMATDNTTLTDNNRCTDAVAAFIAHGKTQLLACMVSTAEIGYIQAEGMVDGMIPSRTDYGAGDQPGTLSGDPVPNQVAYLLTGYEEPADIAAGKKMRTCHTFIPGVSKSALVGDFIGAGPFAALLAWGVTMQNGYAVATGSGKWYRYLSAPFHLTANPTPPPAFHRTRPRGTQIPRIAQLIPRAYTGTQRRRQIPHV